MTPFLRTLLLVALLAVPALADRGAFVIRDFHADLTVVANANLIVEERIEVEFSEPRHGIYRSIPVNYTDPRGYGYSLGFRFIEAVSPSGESYGTSISKNGRYVEIRLGDADTMVNGNITYLLRYEVRQGLVHFAEHDELYWNVTGAEWRTHIEQASATVHLPGAVPPEELETQAFAGPYGSIEPAADGRQASPSVIEFETNRVLAPMEGLTIAVGWQHGLVNFPGPIRRTLTFLVDNWIILTPFLALGWLWRRYRPVGRDPAGRGTVMVRYEPPEGMSPGEIGTLVDEKVDLRDITATVVDLAVRGYLRITTREDSKFGGLWSTEETVFERLPAAGKPKPSTSEAQVLNALFESGSSVTGEHLKNRFHKHIPGIQSTLFNRLTADGYFDDSPAHVRGRYTFYAIAAAIGTTGLGALWATVRGGIIPNALVLPVVAGVLTGLAFAAFAKAMPRRTAKGVEMREWALGFEEFVGRVERDQLEVDRAKSVFETMLPYAMALGVASEWAKQFEGIYEEGAGPSWYGGVHPGSGFSTRGFERSLSGAMAETGQAMTSVPRSQGSSGTGGGGFSGGGGGGGGGGSW